MVLTPLSCPSCHETDVVKYGQISDGKQRFYRQNALCTRKTFLLEYSYKLRIDTLNHQVLANQH
jgi:transposase-like protein